MKQFIKIPVLSFLVIALLSLSSCLKDSRYVDLSSAGPVAELPLSGTNYFSADAITVPGLDTIKFAVNIASATVPTTATTIVVGVDNTQIATYLATNSTVPYIAFPANAYTFPDMTVTIPAGQREAILTLYVNKAVLSPALSYMLPITIKSAPGLTISGNFGTHFYHVIGNDFAGAYLHDYTRVPASGNYTNQAATIYPVTPSQFEAYSGYYTGTARYEVTFTETGSGSTAVYSNFAVSINSDDINNIFTPNGITVSTAPVINGYVPGQKYTFAQAVALFSFTYGVTTSSGATRTITDYFHH